MSSERSQAEADQHLRARRPARAQVVGEPVGARVELAVGERRARRRPTATASGVRVACASNSSCRQRVAADSAVARSRSRLDQELPRARPRASSGSADMRASGSAHDARRAARWKCPSSRVDRRGVEQVGAVLERRRRRPLVGLGQRRASGRTWRCRVGVDSRAALSPRQRRAPRPAAFCSANITWKSGVRLEVALGVQLLDQPLERQVLVRVGAEARLAHAREQLAEGRLAGEVGRAAPAC